MNGAATPLVSVVIPTYNHAQFLGRALQSVLDQTYTNWEAIVIDNHSTDNTDGVVISFSEPRIRLIKIHNDGVIAASRNLGIREAKGEWIAFLDSDDYWYSQKLKVIMATIAVDDKYDVVSNDELMVNNKTGKKRTLHHGPYQNDFYRTLLVEGNRLSPSGTVVRRNFVVANNIFFSTSRKYVTVEDYDFWMNLALNNAKFKFIHEVQGEYVIHGTNGSSKFDLHWNNAKTLLYDHTYNIQQFSSAPNLVWRSIILRLNLIKFRHYISSRQFLLAVSQLFQIMIEHPLPLLILLYSRLRKHFFRVIVR